MNFLTALLLGAHHTPLHKGPQHPSYATEFHGLSVYTLCCLWTPTSSG